MTELPKDVTAAVWAVHQLLVQMRWMAMHGEFTDKSLIDLLDRLEVLPTRVLDGELIVCFQEIEQLAKDYPNFESVWVELEQAVGPVPAVPWE